MLKPAGAACNLTCDYCYYKEKSLLYKTGEHSSQWMSEELLERFIREYLEAQSMHEVLFIWHGGEPLLRPLSFYRKAIQLQCRYANGRHIDNCIQTNGVLLNDEWCRFLKDNNWLVGISIDGPEELHNAYRRTRKGYPTFDEVMRGIALLDQYGVEWNAMAVVNNLTAEHPLDFYRFFREIGCNYIQFTPVVERIRQHADGRTLAHPDEPSCCPMTPHSVNPQQWGNFLCTLFDEWVAKDVGKCFIQLFDATLANWAGVPPGICSMSAHCGHAAAMEYNGDVYACDHYVFPEYKLGNLYTHTLTEMLYSKQQMDFGRMKQSKLPDQCRQCKYLFACHGECPKNRFCTTANGEPGLNYLCSGYYRFFTHAAPYMDYMKLMLDQGLPPAKVMEQVGFIKRKS